MSTTCRLDGRPSTSRFDLEDPCGSTGTIAVRDGHESTATTAYKTGAFPSISTVINIPPNPHELEAGMRKFSIHGPYGMNISLTSALGGRLSVTFPHISNRASSEPPPTTSTPLPHSALRAAHSIDLAISMPMDDTPSPDPAVPRAPSPAPTEIEDPDPDSILADLQAFNIKVRDFAYPAPAPPPTPAKSAPKPPKVHTPAPIAAPAVEIFDQYKGIAEFEYRLAQSPRLVPIGGKTMRRLLDLGWITLEEAQARLHAIDWAVLKEYDARIGRDSGEQGKGKGKGKDTEPTAYPWRPCKWSTVPTPEERVQLLIDRGGYFHGYDRVRRQLEYAAAREERERAEAEEAEERLGLRERERRMAGVGGMDLDEDAVTGAGAGPSSSAGPRPPLSPSRKRSFDASDAGPSEPSSTDPTDGDAKRQRRSLSPAPSPHAHKHAHPHAHAYPLPPARQYPAPLSSYDPELYPEAASVIESQDRPPPPPPRADTPPARSDTPPLDEDGEPEHVGQPLVRRVPGLKRTLSRTQTFKQL